ncbi:hypothetical protein OC709_02285 ['Planchonia careya' phytoplasma]|nr:hypothetical protein ['Planchonia careya' phytoplasma]MDO8030327.1 hypothetical protein ['Planchonia careya' phytoplasma]
MIVIVNLVLIGNAIKQTIRVMLPSDVLEVYELKKGINSDLATIEARRHQAEKEYQQWQAGINLYLTKRRQKN